MGQHLEEIPEKADRVGELCSQLMDPSNTLSYKALGEKFGFCNKAVKKLHQRLMTTYLPQHRELRVLTGKKMLAKIEDRLDATLDFMTDAKLAGAGAKDLAIVFGVLAEKRQLLRGEPTQIMSIEDSRTLNKLMPAFVAEAKRRGLDLNMPVVEGEFSNLNEAHVSPRKNPIGAKGGARKSKPGRSQSPLR